MAPGAAEDLDELALLLSEADARFIGPAPSPAVVAVLAPAIRRRGEAGGVERLEWSDATAGRTHRFRAVLRAVGDLPPFRVAVALTIGEGREVHRLSRFDLLLQTTREGIWEWVVDGDAVWWNARCNDIFGYPPEAAPSFAGWTERIHSEDRQRVLAGYLATVDSARDRWQDEYRIVRVDGAVRVVHDRGEVERDASGKALRLVGARTDVTDERNAEAARAELDQQFRQMAETLGDALWMADADTREVVYVNPACDRIFGRPAHEVLGKPEAFQAMIHPEDRPRVAPRLLEQARGEHDETYRIVRPDGKVRWVRGRAAPIHDAEGRVKGIVGLTSDITVQHQLEEQLQQSRKMESVGRLAGGVAHDFNNLLTVILAGCEFGLLALPAEHEARADIEQAKGAAERAAKLTSQLLAFARRQVVAPVRLDLNELAQQMDGLLRRLIGEHIELRTTLSEGLHPVLADRGQIEQVLMNLAVNARDAMAGGGRLLLETGNMRVDEAYAQAHVGLFPGDFVMLAVSDTGGGIPREVQEHMFEPFFTTKPAGRGTGLGLATCYGIVRQAGGQILVYSELGRGTTFKILLPRSDAAPGVVAPALDTPPPGGSETVLFVEDEATVRAVGIRILKQRGYQVLEACGGEEALRVAARHAGQIDLMVTDVVMPQMSGTELARRLNEERPQLKVLFTSGYTENTVVHHGVLEPSIAFLQKPYVVDSLLDKVREVLDG